MSELRYVPTAAYTFGVCHYGHTEPYRLGVVQADNLPAAFELARKTIRVGQTETLRYISVSPSRAHLMQSTRLYIAVLEEVPAFMVPTLVAHAMLGADMTFDNEEYRLWKEYSFKKCVVKVNRKEFAKITEIPGTYLAHENTTLSGEKSCAVVIPMPDDERPNVLKFAKLWQP